MALSSVLDKSISNQSPIPQDYFAWLRAIIADFQNVIMYLLVPSFKSFEADNSSMMAGFIESNSKITMKMQLTVTKQTIDSIAQSNSLLQKMFSNTLQNIDTEDGIKAFDDKFNLPTITISNQIKSGSLGIIHQRDEQDDIIKVGKPPAMPGRQIRV
ncbi:hypothetical protein AGMMS49579_07290 [Spirochaetia bacterium]|nr:hypothetical protein AGMMS49579_07290 [Spirochaetia bacterium]